MSTDTTESTGYARTVGAWTVEVDMSEARAYNGRTGDLFSTSVILFPVGYRVGQRWSNGPADVTGEVPKSVTSAANALARRLPL